MLLRTIVGLLIGLACGACVGTVGFAAGESLFGRGSDMLGASPRLAAIIGAVFVGLPGAAVGAIVGGFNLGKLQGSCVGVAVALLLAVLFMWHSETKYFYESGYFDRRLFFDDLFSSMTWLLGLAFAAVIASASVRRFFMSSR